MGVQVTIGGDRLRSGSKMRTNLHGYGWSSHDLSYVWRSTQNFGTLVPCFKKVALVGDTWHIDTSVMARTLPTAGPLYGSAKVQVDFFFYPFRLAIGALHNNLNGIGMNMENVLFPEIKLKPYTNLADEIDNSQIAPDSLHAYLGIRGVGNVVGYQNLINNNGAEISLERAFNGTPFIAYMDIVKNFYINKQENNFPVITAAETGLTIDYAKIFSQSSAWKVYESTNTKKGTAYLNTIEIYTLFSIKLGAPISQENLTEQDFISNFKVWVRNNGQDAKEYRLNGKRAIFKRWIKNDFLNNITGLEFYYPNTEFRNLYSPVADTGNITITAINSAYTPNDTAGKYVFNTIKFYPIKQLDDMRALILSQNVGERITIDDKNTQNLPEVYARLAKKTVNWAVDEKGRNIQQLYAYYSQSGLAIKTYQSDIFNNWLKTSWIEEISQKSKVITTSGGFTMDALAMARRTWNYLNRIAVSGGTYQDWEEATTGIDVQHFCESPIFMGGMSFDLVFDEIVSTAASGDEPLGTLAGRGNITNVKGGKITIKAKEYGYIIGIVSYTPRIDYYQGNEWDEYSLNSMADLYKPEFAGIGFQDLITEQMAWWTTSTSIDDGNKFIQKSAGKQPSWLQYQTAYNQVYGDFARAGNADFMVITRRYKPNNTFGEDILGIRDLTSYIDPTDYSYLFAKKDIDTQPIWTQIKFDVEVRRIMSASVMPSL